MRWVHEYGNLIYQIWKVKNKSARLSWHGMRLISKLKERDVISIVQLIKMDTHWIFNFVKSEIIRLPMPS